MKGQWVKNCGCAYVCPYILNAGHCEVMIAMDIDGGHFDSVDLAGLSFAGPCHGALQDGNAFLAASAISAGGTSRT